MIPCQRVNASTVGKLDIGNSSVKMKGCAGSVENWDTLLGQPNLTKAIRADAAKKVRKAEKALDAKRIGHNIRDPQDWQSEKEAVMEEIVNAKVDQIPEINTKLETFNNDTMYSEGTFDMEWGTGLDVDATLNTDPKKWPYENKLGKIYQKIAYKFGRKLRSASVPRTKGATNERQSNIEELLKDVRNDKKGKKNDKCGARK
ncbi:uncharacterized protein LOC128183625 [Crassostrea angulata]|uniref:uncharacterized protein LOC128183625 n=1 Tax=Magallana angulata TaxID=2784310 RepID=UPI0022B0B2B3|nr:uncharacterized protein LOC128183625 [Crassostrea angulata]